MRKLLNILTVLPIIGGSVYAGTISNVNLMNLNGELRITLLTDEQCIVSESRAGDIYNLYLKNCKIANRKVFGRQDDITKVIDIIPQDSGTLIKIVPVDKVKVSYSSYPRATTIVVAPYTLVSPVVTTTTDGINVTVDGDVEFSISKSPGKIILTAEQPVLKTTEKKVDSPFVDRISTYTSGNRSYIVISLKTEVPAQVMKVGRTYEIKFLKPVATASSKLSDRKIKLDFTNADVRTVVRAIADTVGVNVVFDPDVKGTVSVRFLTPVNWQEALKAVLEPLGYTYVREKDYLRIASRKTLMQEVRYEPVNTYIVPLNYAYASEVAKLIEKYLGSAESKNSKVKAASKELVEVDERTNSLILKVTREHYDRIMDIIRHTDKITKQVSIEAKIVLVSSSFEKDLGVNWNLAFYTGSNWQHSYKTGSFQLNDGVTIPGVTDPLSVGNVYNIPSQPYTLALGILNKGQSLRAELAIQASELNGDGKLISQPKVVTLDNKEATIEQGMEIPYKVIDENGNISTEFKKASLILKVRPHVTNDNKIVLDLEIKKDKPNYDYVAITGNSEPAIDTRNVKTQIMVDNGDTLVIGGIYEQEKSKSQTGVPVLSKIPLLGWLFKNEVVKNSNSELLIFITPKVITPSSK
ncbi:type IV pilus secretin PilQ [Desulfurobacterium sp. TC5-1]|uniref:type IV pilus secretin PilQ n=1 Tax=Desulfurobacterium sp. TC5-1 TaxID=1158318 RepID=UPI0003B48A02|nr:type IV pilus secretin PilQ [Desulfurobacterium sp. TC5-1]